MRYLFFKISVIFFIINDNMYFEGGLLNKYLKKKMDINMFFINVIY